MAKALPTTDEFAAMKDIVASDPALQMMLAERLMKSGLVEALGFEKIAEAKTTLIFPDEWSALQIGVFDNGYQLDKRGRERATKTRWGLDVKAWVDTNPDWHKPTYKTPLAMWSLSFARKQIPSLIARGSITEQFGQEIIASLPDAKNVFVGIPRSKSKGTRYADGTYFMLVVHDEEPCAVFASINGAAYSVTKLVDEYAGGKKLTKAKCMARVSRRHEFVGWSTEVL